MIVVRILLVMMIPIVHIVSHVNTRVVVIFGLFSPLAHLLLHLFLLGHLACEQVLLIPVLLLLILARLLLFHGLKPHPILVTIRASFVDHLLFDLFAAVELPQVRDFFGLVDLFLHEPVVHGLAPLLVLLTLLLRHGEQLFFDLILRLVDELTP